MKTIKSLLSKKAREKLGEVSISMLLSDEFIQTNDILTARDREKLEIIKESYASYVIKNFEGKKILSTQDAGEFGIQLLGEKKQEHLVAVYLNSKNKVLSHKTIFIGSVNQSVAHPLKKNWLILFFLLFQMES